MDDREFAARIGQLSTARPDVVHPAAAPESGGSERLARADAFVRRVVQSTLAEFAATVGGQAPRVVEGESRLVCECAFGGPTAPAMVRIKVHATRDGAVLADFFLEPWHVWSRELLLTTRDLDPSHDAENQSQLRQRLLDLYGQYLVRRQSASRRLRPATKAPAGHSAARGN